MVRSIGFDVEQNGLGFVWLAGCKPYYVRNPAECHVSCNEDSQFYAPRVSQNAPFFQSNFEVIPGVPAAVEHSAEDFRVETPPELLEEPAVPDPSVESAVEPGDLGERFSRAAEVREVAPDEVARARAETVSIDHRINHFPKLPLCDICNRAKLFSKRIRSHRILDPESDLPESSKFGEQVAVDHMVVWTSSGGKEFLVLIGYDSFSGIANAYPASSKGFMSSSFCWPEIQKPRHGCRGDAAPELVKAIRDLEWLPETALPRRWPHNAKLECTIRTLEECCRCLHLQAGFAILPKSWPITCRYAAVAISIEKREKAFGTEFKGANYALGQLVFYRTKSQYKPKLDPNASRALMAGWKLEFGLSIG